MAIAPSLLARLQMAATHLCASALVGAVASWIIFAIWYPSPFASISGATNLFEMLIAVDLVLGPALTAVAASPGKPRRVFVRDLIVIVCLQLAGFGYGMYTIALARPVALVFEVDLVRLVSAADIEPGSEAMAPSSLRSLSWTGPVLMSAALPAEGDEKFRAIELGLAGIHLAMQPAYWRDYASQSAVAWKAARPVSQLVSQYPSAADDLAGVSASVQASASGLRFLPLTSRHEDWVVLLAEPGARVVGYLPLNGFF